MKNIWLLLFSLLFVLSMLSGCAEPVKVTDDTADGEALVNDEEPEAQPQTNSYWSTDSTKLRVVVSIPPQKYFVERIGGSSVEVISLLEEDDDFLTSTPTAEKVAALAEANLYFMIGAPFETKISMPSSVIGIDNRKDLKLKPFSAHTEYLNTAKDNKTDPFYWLSPSMVIQSSSTIYLNLRDHSGGNREEIRTNYTHFVRDLNNLEGDIHRILINSVNMTVYTDYPALGYFGTTFNIKQKDFELASGADINDLARSAIKEDIHTVFFGPFLPSGVKGNLENLIKGTVAPLNPLREGYANNLVDIAEAISSGSAQAQ